jgi:uncharacterized membrane protein
MPSSHAEPPAPSTTLTRWGLPLAQLWAAVLLSAYVHTELLGGSPPLTAGLLATLVGTPAAGLGILLALRATAARAGGATRRSDDLVVSWVMTFLFALHAALLAVAVGLLSALTPAVVVAASGLFIGLGPLLAALEPGSPMGLRTRATLASPAVWGATHRLAGRALSLAGALGLLGLAVQGPAALYLAVLPATAALVLAAVVGPRRAPAATPSSGSAREVGPEPTRLAPVVEPGGQGAEQRDDEDRPTG